ncbi:MAG TPA: hypothetical protein PLN52_04050 [Opitutaceae bacterium]|nr:hypothetical protein [Opitutaceae bacterium]
MIFISKRRKKLVRKSNEDLNFLFRKHRLYKRKYGALVRWWIECPKRIANVHGGFSKEQDVDSVLQN